MPTTTSRTITTTAGRGASRVTSAGSNLVQGMELVLRRYRPRLQPQSLRMAAAVHEKAPRSPPPTEGEGAPRVASCGTLPGSPSPLVQLATARPQRRRRRKGRGTRQMRVRMQLVVAETTTTLRRRRRRRRLRGIPPRSACIMIIFPDAARAADARKTTPGARKPHPMFLPLVHISSILVPFLPHSLSLSRFPSCCLKCISVYFLCCVRPSCNQCTF